MVRQRACLLACLLPRQLDRDRHIRAPAKLRGRTARRTSANSSRSLSLSFLSTARHRCRAQQAMQRQNYTLLSHPFTVLYSRRRLN